MNQDRAGHSFPPRSAGVLSTLSAPHDVLRAILDDVSDGFTAFDRAWRVTYINRASGRLLGRLGRTPEDLIGKNVWDVFPEFVGTDIHAQYLRAMDGRENVEFEIYYPPLDSWFQTRLYPTVEGLLAYSHDFTAQKRSEQLLAERAQITSLTAEVGKALASGRSQGEMLQGCCEAIVAHLNAAFARIWVLNEEERVLELKASAGIYTHLDGAHSRVPVGSFKIGLIAEERKPHLTNTVVGDPRVGDQEWAVREGMVAFAGYPLIVDDRLVGVAAMFARHTLSEGVLDALAAVADEIAVGIVRKQAEESVREGRKWLDTTLRSIGDGVIATDAEGRVTLMNRVAETLTGWPQSEACGKPLVEVFEIVNETTRQTVENPVEKVIREGRIVGLANHTVLISRSGKEVAIDDSAAPIQDAEGELQGVVLVFRDVTVQRLSERHVAAQYGVSAALAQASTIEQMAEAVLEAIGRSFGWTLGLLWLQDEETETLTARAVWEATPGARDHAGFVALSREKRFRRGEGLPGEVFTRGAPEWLTDIATSQNFPRKPAATAEGIRSGMGIPLKSGGRVHGVAEFFHTEMREPDAEMLRTLAGLGSQIGEFIERRRTEEAVRESEALKSAMLTAALDAIVTIDHTGRILEWNPMAEMTFGYSREEAVGREMAELIVPPALRARHYDGFARHLQSGRVSVLGRRLELIGARKDGTEFPAEIAINRISTQPPRFTGFIRDITERVSREAELKTAAESLRREQERQAVMMRYLRASNRVAAVFASLLSPDAIAEKAVAALVSDFDARAAGVWLTDTGRQRLKLAAEKGLGDPLPLSLEREIDIVMHAFKIGWVARYGRPYVGPISPGDIQFEQKWAERAGVGWAAVYPLVAREKLHGVLAGFFPDEMPLGGSDVLATLVASMSGSLDTVELVSAGRAVADTPLTPPSAATPAR